MIGGFNPIVGSGFDEIARQRQFLLGLDASIQQQNLQRQSEAERQSQNWLQNVATMKDQAQQSDIQRQLAADAQARQDALQAHSEAVRQHELAQQQGIQQSQFKAQLDYQKETAAAGERIAQAQLALKAKNDQEKIDNLGQHFATNYLVTRNNADNAASAATALKQQLDEANSQVSKLGNSKDDLLAKLPLNAKIKQLEKELPVLERQARIADTGLSAFTNSASNKGYEINEDGSVVHTDTGKKWNWKNALKSATDQYGGMGPPPPAGYSFGDRETGRTAPITPPVWPGFTQGTGTTSAPAAPTPPQSPFPEGTVIRSKKDGNLYRVVNGVPVMIPPQDQP